MKPKTISYGLNGSILNLYDQLLMLKVFVDEERRKMQKKIFDSNLVEILSFCKYLCDINFGIFEKYIFQWLISCKGDISLVISEIHNQKSKKVYWWNYKVLWCTWEENFL